ncbi:MAG: FGGY family carbohydrate kinase [Promethearchaeota archaeon]
MPYRLVLDIGSKVTKVAIGDEKLNIIALQEIQIGAQCSDDGFCRAYNPTTYWEQIIHAMKQVIATSGIDPLDIDYFTCASIRPSCVFTDDDYNPIYIGPSFDLRGIDGADDLEEQFRDMAGKSVFEVTGHFPAMLFPPARYLWFKENEEKKSLSISKYMPVESWVLIKLGGEEHTSISSAAESGFFDIERMEWSHEWLDILDIEESFLPPVIQSGEIIGDVSQEIQDVLGVNSNAQIVSGLPDTQAALIGAGCTGESSNCAVAGSTVPVQVLKKDCFIDPNMNTWTTCLNLKDIVDSYIVETNCGISGQILRWAGGLFYSETGNFKNEYYSKLDADYDEFDRNEFQTVTEGKDVLAFLGPNYLSSASSSISPGVFVFPTPGMVDEAMATRQQFIASIFDNIQFAIFKNLQHLRGMLGINAGKTYILGGITRSNTFTQRFTDLNGDTTISSNQVEATTIGLLLTCARAANEIKTARDLEDKIEQAHLLTRNTPREAVKNALRGRFAVWDGFRKRIRDF